jgi:hypothetical protein
MSDERDEAELRQLFNDSAEEPSRAEIDRLARFAASIPARAAARSRWAWLPSLRVQTSFAIAGAALSVVAFVAVRSIDVDDMSGAVAENSTAATEAATEAAAEAPGNGAVVVEVAEEDPFDGLGDALLAELNADSFVAYDDDSFEDSLAELDVMAGPVDGVDAAAWMELYDRALDDG